MKKRVLFVCTHNACRPQMAEGLLRLTFGAQSKAYSAGTAPTRVNPWAIRAIREVRCDISGQLSKHVDEFLDETFDVVVTTCDSAKETCPVFPGAKQMIRTGEASQPQPALLESLLGDPRRKQPPAARKQRVCRRFALDVQ